jgi:hypothetical protein
MQDAISIAAPRRRSLQTLVTRGRALVYALLLLLAFLLARWLVSLAREA